MRGNVKPLSGIGAIMINLAHRKIPQKWARGGVLFLCCAFLIGTFAAHPAVSLAQQNDSNAAAQALALVNQWRLDQGLWPLKVNKALQTMAVAQAAYIAPKIASIPDDNEAAFHLDAQGHTPPERAIGAPYNWPLYGKARSAQIEVGENAAVGSVQFAVNFWKGSPIHAKAALNATYREVGVGAVPHGGGYVFIMDFGARPGILTALANSSGDGLYLTNERSNYSTLKPDATQFRVFSADGTPLSVTLPWQPTVSLPSGSTGTEVYVLYTNGDFQAVAPVNLTDDLAVLPSGQRVVSAMTLVVSPAASVTPRPTTSAPATVSPPSVTPTPAGTTRASNIGLQSSKPDLILTYNSRSLVLFNNAPNAVNLTGISMGSDSNRITIEAFTAVSQFSISAFPVGSCLQIQLSGTSDSAPSSCRFIRSLINVSTTRLFWTGTFTVTQGNVILATCDAGAGRCEVLFPAVTGGKLTTK